MPWIMGSGCLFAFPMCVAAQLADARPPCDKSSHLGIVWMHAKDGKGVPLVQASMDEDDALQRCPGDPVRGVMQLL